MQKDTGVVSIPGIKESDTCVGVPIGSSCYDIDVKVADNRTRVSQSYLVYHSTTTAEYHIECHLS